MRVKIGDTWYSSDEEPICIEFTEEDKRNISGMDSCCSKYASAPDDHFDDADDFRSWMQEEN